jgi:hypothetical protein
MFGPGILAAQQHTSNALTPLATNDRVLLTANDSTLCIVAASYLPSRAPLLGFPVWQMQAAGAAAARQWLVALALHFALCMHAHVCKHVIATYLPMDAGVGL